MRIYHIERDYNLTLKEQKKQLAEKYAGFNYLFSDGRKLHFMAEGER